MRINEVYGSKGRLFDMMKKVNSLNESDMPKDSRDKIINSFIEFADAELELNGELPEVELIDDIERAKEMKSYGGYTPAKKSIMVVTAGRALADSLRTLAHELVHHKQNLDDILNQNSGQTGSPEENEANSVAGILLRDFGKNNPTIY